MRVEFLQIPATQTEKRDKENSARILHKFLVSLSESYLKLFDSKR